MNSVSAPAGGTASKARGIASLLPRAAERHGKRDAVMFKEGGSWRTRSYAEVGATVGELAKGLMALGVERGDKVSILANTRPEWSYYDFAALSAGATVVPIYQTNSPEECQYVLEDSDAKVVVVEDESQLAKIGQVRDSLPALEHVVLMVGEASDAISTAQLVERGAGTDDAAWERRYESVVDDDVCTIIYTSGTTGPPKGCVISHANYRAMVDMVTGEDVVGGDDLIYLFLPLAHSFAMLIQLGAFELGSTMAYWSLDPKKIIEDVSEVKPTYLPSVPRIFGVAYFVSVIVVAPNPGSTASQVLSLVPLLAPIAMPARIASGEAAVWEIAASIGLMLVAITVMVAIAGKVYERALLHTGGRVRLADALRRSHA